MDIYVARQPIFDEHMKLFGYELLYRRSSSNFYEGENPNTATMELLHSSFVTVGFDQLTDGTRGFINFTQELLESGLANILPKDRVVVEILENVEANDVVIAECKSLKKQGFVIALDDFIFNRTDRDYTPLIELADIIKIEFPITKKEHQRRLLKKYANRVTFLAEKVETREEYAEAVKMGYQLFQGYFFSKPVMVKSKEIATLNVHLVHILEELHKADPDFFAITESIQKDLGLSYKILKMANSIYFGGKTKINSLRQAVIRLGTQEMKRWVSIMLIREFENDENSELIKICLLRGRLLSLLARELNQSKLEADYFLTGILSSIDVILSQDMEKILSTLALSEEVKSTLLGGPGQLAECLQCIILYEKFKFDNAQIRLEKMNIPFTRFMALYFEALTWLKSTAE